MAVIDYEPTPTLTFDTTCASCGSWEVFTILEERLHHGCPNRDEIRVSCQKCGSDLTWSPPDETLNFKLKAKKRYEERLRDLNESLSDKLGRPEIDDRMTTLRLLLIEDMMENEMEHREAIEEDIREDALWDYRQKYKHHQYMGPARKEEALDGS